MPHIDAGTLSYTRGSRTSKHRGGPHLIQMRGVVWQAIGIDDQVLVIAVRCFDVAAGCDQLGSKS